MFLIVIGLACVFGLVVINQRNMQFDKEAKAAITTVDEDQELIQLVNSIKDDLSDTLGNASFLVIRDVCLACIDMDELNLLRSFIQYYREDPAKHHLVIVGELSENDAQMLESQLLGSPTDLLSVHIKNGNYEFTVIWVEFIASSKPIILSGEILRQVSRRINQLAVKN